MQDTLVHDKGVQTDFTHRIDHDTKTDLMISRGVQTDLTYRFDREIQTEPIIEGFACFDSSRKEREIKITNRCSSMMCSSFDFIFPQIMNRIHDR